MHVCKCKYSCPHTHTQIEYILIYIYIYIYIYKNICRDERSSRTINTSRTSIDTNAGIKRDHIPIKISFTIKRATVYFNYSTPPEDVKSETRVDHAYMMS